MIHYDLRCAAGHGFDGWFKDSAGFDAQAAGGLVECPSCGSTAVSKQLMAPAIAKKGRSRVAEVAPPDAKAPGSTPSGTPSGPPSHMTPSGSTPPGPMPGEALVQAAARPVPAQLVALLQRVRAELEKNADYVGRNFAAEARRLHRQAQRGQSQRGQSERGGGPTAPRGIYGETSDAEAEALHEEGIEVARIPWVPPADA